MKTVHPVWHNMYFPQTFFVVQPSPHSSCAQQALFLTSCFLNSRFPGIPFPFSLLPSYHAPLCYVLLLFPFSSWFCVFSLLFSLFWWGASPNLPSPTQTSCGFSDFTEQYLLHNQLTSLSLCIPLPQSYDLHLHFY